MKKELKNVTFPGVACLTQFTPRRQLSLPGGHKRTRSNTEKDCISWGSWLNDRKERPVEKVLLGVRAKTTVDRQKKGQSRIYQKHLYGSKVSHRKYSVVHHLVATIFRLLSAPENKPHQLNFKGKKCHTQCGLHQNIRHMFSCSNMR